MINLLTNNPLIKITRIGELNLSPAFIVVVFTLETIAVKESNIQYICNRIETQARQCCNMYTPIISSWKLVVFNSFPLIHGISILLSFKSKRPQSASDNCRTEIRLLGSQTSITINSYELGNRTCHQDL